jgi:predicted nucleic acid-binding Zn finger protein
MRVGRLFEKAQRLVASGRVESLGGGVYNVVGDHGTYAVVQDYTGKLSCSCPGFMQKAKCSHVTAVMLLTKTKRRQKPRKANF